MAKVKVGAWEIEEGELDQQLLAAKQRGQERLLYEPQASTARYDVETDRLVIELKNGVMVQLPRPLIEGLGEASPEEMSQVRLGPRGASLHWDRLGVDYSVPGLLTGLFGTRTWVAALGQKGGRARSTSKSRAARENGKKGGRPVKERQTDQKVGQPA